MYLIGGVVKWWALEVLICSMGSSTHKKTSQVYEITGFYPFNGVAMWELKYTFKNSHKNYFLLFFVKVKIEKKSVESLDEN